MENKDWQVEDIFDSDDEIEMQDSEDEDAEYHDPGSDDDQSCPICLNEFEEQQIGLPNNCQHVFCIDCILEWSKKSNSCPVDRKKFQVLRVFHCFGGLFHREVAIQESAYQSDDAYEIETLCEICNSGDNEETLLLCDGCDLGFHCGCLTPPLQEVPSGEWFCNSCKNERRETSSIAQPRLVGRTNLSERVRSRVSQTRRRHAENYSTLDEQLDAIVDEILSNAAHRFRETTPSLTRRQSSKRKTTRRRRRRRKGRRNRSQSNKRLTGANAKPTGFTKDDVRSMHSFSVTGRSNDINEFSASKCADSEVPSHVIAKRHKLLTQSALQFNKPLPSLFSLHEEVSASFPPMSPPPPIPDLLSSIFSDQNLLFAPSSEVTIQRGGNLILNKQKPVQESNKFERPFQTTARHPTPFAERDSQRKLSSEAEKKQTKVKEILPVPAPETKPVSPPDLKPVPAPVVSVDDSSKSTLSRTSVSSNTAKPSILIKPIFSLPSAKKSDPSEDDVYDPFRPTESDDNMEISDAESEGSPVVEKEKPEEIPKAPEKEKLEEVDAPSEDKDPVAEKAEVKEEEVNSSEKETSKKPKELSSPEDDFEVDIFAEEELEKAQAEATRTASEMPDPLKLWRDEVRQSALAEESSQVVLPALDIRSSPASAPMKFKKISRKDVEDDGKSRYRSRKGSSSKDVNDTKSDSKIKKSSSKKEKKVSKADKKSPPKLEEISKVRKRHDSYHQKTKGFTAAFKDDSVKSNQSRLDRPKRPTKLKSSSTKPVESPTKYQVLSPTRSRKRRSDSDHHSSTLLPYRTKSPGDDVKRKKAKRTDEPALPKYALPKDYDKKRRADEKLHRRDLRKEKERNEPKESIRRKDTREKIIEKSASVRKRNESNSSHNLNEKLLLSLKTLSDRQLNAPDAFIHAKKKAPDSQGVDMQTVFVEAKSHIRRSSSSESIDEKDRRKKKKKRFSKRDLSSSSDSIQKVKKKKKKRSRSPKKKKSRKISKKIEKQQDSTLSFEHIFADFDDLKKRKKEKIKHRKKSKTKEKRSTEVEEEEISVIYEYESLSEGEIISSDERLERKKFVVSNTVQSSLTSPVNARKKTRNDTKEEVKTTPISTGNTWLNSVVVKIESNASSKLKPSSPVRIEAASAVVDDRPGNLTSSSTAHDQVVSKPSNDAAKESFDKPVLASTDSFEKQSSVLKSDGHDDIFELDFSPAVEDVQYEDVEVVEQEEFAQNDVVITNSPKMTFEEASKSVTHDKKSHDSEMPRNSPMVSDAAQHEPVLSITGSVEHNSDLDYPVVTSPAISVEAVIVEENEFVSSAAGDTPQEETTRDSVEEYAVVQSSSPAASEDVTSGGDMLPLLRYLKSLKQPESSALSNMASALSAQQATGDKKKDVDNFQDVGIVLHQIDDLHLPPAEDCTSLSRSRLRSKSRDSLYEQELHPVAVPHTPPLEDSPGDLSPLENFPAGTATVKPSLDSVKTESDQSTPRKFVSESRATDSLPVLRSDGAIRRMTARVSPLTVKNIKKGSELYSPLYPKSPVPLSRDRSVPVRSVVDSRTSTLLSSPMHSTQSSSFADLTATSGEQAARKSSFDRRSPASKDATSYSSAIKDAKVYSSTTSLADALKVLTSLSAHLKSSTRPDVKSDIATSSEAQKQTVPSSSCQSKPKLPRSTAKLEPSSVSKSQKAQKHRPTFQEEVIKHAKTALVPYFKRREVSKEQYKGIMKKAVNKICKENKGKDVEPEKIHKLIRKYVKNCLNVNEKNKERMRNLLDRKVNKDIKKRLLDDLEFSTSPPSPVEET